MTTGIFHSPTLIYYLMYEEGSSTLCWSNAKISSSSDNTSQQIKTGERERERGGINLRAGRRESGRDIRNEYNDDHEISPDFFV